MKRVFKNRRCPDCGGIMRDSQPPFLCENCGEWKSKGRYYRKPKMVWSAIENKNIKNPDVRTG